MHIDEEFFTNIPLAMFFIDSINKVGIMAPTLPGKYGIVMKCKYEGWRVVKCTL